MKTTLEVVAHGRSMADRLNLAFQDDQFARAAALAAFNSAVVDPTADMSYSVSVDIDRGAEYLSVTVKKESSLPGPATVVFPPAPPSPEQVRLNERRVSADRAA